MKASCGVPVPIHRLFEHDHLGIHDSRPVRGPAHLPRHPRNRRGSGITLDNATIRTPNFKATAAGTYTATDNVSGKTMTLTVGTLGIHNPGFTQAVINNTRGQNLANGAN